MCERVCVCVCLWSGGGASVVGENESGENQVNFKSLRTYSGHTEKDCDVIYLINKISLFFFVPLKDYIIVHVLGCCCRCIFVILISMFRKALQPPRKSDRNKNGLNCIGSFYYPAQHGAEAFSCYAAVQKEISCQQKRSKPQV